MDSRLLWVYNGPCQRDEECFWKWATRIWDNALSCWQGHLSGFLVVWIGCMWIGKEQASGGCMGSSGGHHLYSLDKGGDLIHHPYTTWTGSSYAPIYSQCILHPRTGTWHDEHEWHQYAGHPPSGRGTRKWRTASDGTNTIRGTAFCRVGTWMLRFTRRPLLPAGRSTYPPSRLCVSSTFGPTMAPPAWALCRRGSGTSAGWARPLILLSRPELWPAESCSASSRPEHPRRRDSAGPFTACQENPLCRSRHPKSGNCIKTPKSGDYIRTTEQGDMPSPSNDGHAVNGLECCRIFHPCRVKGRWCEYTSLPEAFQGTGYFMRTKILLYHDTIDMNTMGRRSWLRNLHRRFEPTPTTTKFPNWTDKLTYSGLRIHV